MRLEFGCDVFESGNCEPVRDARTILVSLLMETAMGGPGARWPLSVGFTAGRKATGLPDETERRGRRKPLKPVVRIGHQTQFAFL
jgi:hypothetical protein